MAFYFTYKTSDASLALSLSQNNLFSHTFVQLLDICYSNPTAITFNTQRNNFRDILFHHNETKFPRYGPNPVSVFEIFHTLQHNPQTHEFNYLTFQAQFLNSNHTLQIHMPYYLSLNIINHDSQHTISIQNYMTTYIHDRVSTEHPRPISIPTLHFKTCVACP